jgi:two-component system chemotaxis response regulator CheY
LLAFFILIYWRVANICQLFQIISSYFIFRIKSTATIGKTMSPRQIILVENDINLGQSIALILQRAGYLVAATDRVDKAMELLSNRIYHLLISDVNIPETRAILLPKVSKIYPHLPIVILTDQSIAEVERERKLSGAHYLIKPVAPEYLLDSVGSIIGNRNNNNHLNNGLPLGHQ